MTEEPSDWKLSKRIAQGMLQNKEQRRMLVAKFVLFTTVWIAVGIWVIDDWLAERALRFLVWWAICAGFSITLITFAIYDALLVFRDEHGRK